MPRPVSKIKDNNQLIQGLSDGLRYAARNPSIDKYKPHEKQLIFHSSTKPGRQFIGGNRSGKTVGGGAETVMYARGVHPFKSLKWRPPLRLRVVTVDIEEGMKKIILPEIKRWMPMSDLINGSWEDSWDAQGRTLTLANGSFIEILTYEQKLEKFAGTSRHGVWFDEEPPKHIFTECKLRLLDTEGDWWMTMTPVEGMTWTYEDIYLAADPLIDIIEVDMDENPHLSELGKAQALSGLTEDEVEARKHGQYVSVGGMIYTKECVERPFPDGNIIPPLDLNDPPVGLYFAGMDHGYTNPTAWLWAVVLPNGTMIVYDEYYVPGRIIKDHAAAYHEKNKEHGPRCMPVYNIGDPSIRNSLPNTGTSVQIEYMDIGVPIALGNNDVKAGIDLVKKKFMQKKLLITSNCTNLLWELKRYRWATWQHSKDRFEKNKKEEPQKKDDHACDALRYMVASRPEAEDGESIPRAVNSIGAPEAIDPTKGLVDKELSQISSGKQGDIHLGADF